MESPDYVDNARCRAGEQEAAVARRMFVLGNSAMAPRPFRRLWSIVAIFVTGAWFVAGATSAFAGVQKFVYDVQHPTYGKIGTYTNVVKTEGDRTTVTTEGRIRVSILGIVLYRQDLDRVERWVGERLVSFEGK